MDSLTRSLAVEWGPKVRVNTVDVGLCRTEQTADHYGDDATVRAIEDTIPLGRMADPIEVGQVVAFLASDLASYVSGACVECHGGGEPPAFLHRSPEGATVTGILEGRIAIVTGAGRGIGRAHALELARQGARVVVNDLGTSGSGEGAASEVAHSVVAEIEALGGEAVANGADVADFEQAAAMVQQAIDTFGGLDILVNNAGFVRDRMLVNTSEEEWDAVIRVHLKGHFAPLRHAGAWWRSEAKQGRQPVARVINTSSGAGLQGSIGQTTYSTAKAGIAGMTLVAAAELGRYGVNVNAIAPVARTRMTEGAFPEMMAGPADGDGQGSFDAMDPANNSPVVAWLASADCDLTGRVIEIEGGQICLEEGWRHGPKQDLGRRWDAGEVGVALRELVGRAAEPDPVYGT